MPTQRLSMRRIKQLLTMRFGAGASTREIARELGIAPSTVREYLGRASAAGIGWPLAADVTDESLLARLFVNAGVRAGVRFHAEPDWSALVRELRGTGCRVGGDLKGAVHAAVCWYPGVDRPVATAASPPVPKPTRYSRPSPSCPSRSAAACQRARDPPGALRAAA